MDYETIAAIATPAGEGGIGIIRISGDDSFIILDKVFRPHSGTHLKNRMLTYGHIVDPDDGSVVDEVLAVFMKRPKTYTAEDVAEINCHGGIIPLKRVLSLVLRCGARLAEPGEFTKRAFLNGRLDLSQAEAVIDIVRAKTDRFFDAAMDQLEGLLSRKTRAIGDKVMDILVNMAVNIDYPDEDIEELTYDKLEGDLNSVISDIEILLSGAGKGRLLREGVSIGIVGMPNVGKSSLLNCLLREARAIVTEIPGTTRDTIEEYMSIKGIPVKITDTAGIRATDDRVEKIGIERSRRILEESDLVIFVADASRELEPEDMEIMGALDSESSLILLNKTDLDIVTDVRDIEAHAHGVRIIKTSLISGEQTDALEEAIYHMVSGKTEQSKDGSLITGVRHENALREALSSARDALSAAEDRQPLELIEIDVSDCRNSLGTITGETSSGDVIDQVFSRFCLGK